MKMIRGGENSDTLKSWNALVFNYIVEMKKMIRGGENSVPYIPIDLVIEILSRLPSKSIARCRYVSKLWSSNILRPYFTELFLSRSLTRPPRLLLAVLGFDDLSFFTSLQPQNQSMNLNQSSHADDFHMKFPGDKRLEFCGHASGFILMRSQDMLVICNPTTGQYVSLPSPKLVNSIGWWSSFLGFDPIDKQLKVLYIPFGTYDRKDQVCQILTVGTGNDLFRNIPCPLAHIPSGDGICINGVLYYLAIPFSRRKHSRIVSFDVRSEKFKFIQRDFIRKYVNTKLINYKGRLGVITQCLQLKLCIWVIKDVENIESQWSKYFSISWDYNVGCWRFMSMVGVTSRGEIVLTSTKVASNPVYVVYVYPETNTFQKVDIKGLQPNHFDNSGKVVEVISRVEVFADYVDQDLTFIDIMKKKKKTTSVTRPPKLNHKPTTMVTSRPSGSSKARLQQDGSRCTFESIINCNSHKKLGVSSPWRLMDRFGFIILFFLIMMGLLNLVF